MDARERRRELLQLQFQCLAEKLDPVARRISFLEQELLDLKAQQRLILNEIAERGSLLNAISKQLEEAE